MGREEAADCFGQVKVWAGKWRDKEEMGVLGAPRGERVRRGLLLEGWGCLDSGQGNRKQRVGFLEANLVTFTTLSFLDLWAERAVAKIPLRNAFHIKFSFIIYIESIKIF